MSVPCQWAGAKITGKAKAPNPFGAPPCKAVQPLSLRLLSKKLKAAAATDAKEDPSGWIVEDACSAPQTEAFWEKIFADMSSNGGLAVFKQDHGGGEIVQLVAAQRNLSVMENWLGPQGRAAAKVSRF